MSDLIERLRSNAGETAQTATDRLLLEAAARLFVLEAELERLRLSCKGVEGWREIEGAPKGEEGEAPVCLLLCWWNVRDGGGRSYQVGEGYWSAEDSGWWWANTSPGDYYSDRIENCISGLVEFWQPLPAAPVSPSPLMDFGASQVRHQPSAATSAEGSDPTQVKP